MTIYTRVVVSVAVLAAISVTIATAQFPKLELKKSKSLLALSASAMKHGIQNRGHELRSWRLKNLIDYISSGEKVVQDATNPILNKVSKVNGKLCLLFVL